MGELAFLKKLPIKVSWPDEVVTELPSWKLDLIQKKKRVGHERVVEGIFMRFLTGQTLTRAAFIFNKRIVIVGQFFFTRASLVLSFAACRSINRLLIDRQIFADES